VQRIVRFLLVTSVLVPSTVAEHAPTTAAAIQPAILTQSGNLLHNGSFENTGTNWLAPWYLQVRADMGAAATITQDATTAVDGATSADVNVTQPAATSWYVQLTQRSVLLAQGHTYTVSFWAKAATARSIDYALQADVAPTYTVYISGTANLTTTWQHFNATYSHLSATDGQAALRFNLAQTTGQIWIDDVSLTVPARPILSGLSKVIFDDEFDRAGLDTSKWNIESMDPGGFRTCCLTDGLQYWIPQALSFQNGYLRITSDKQSMGRESYDSGAIDTEKKFSFTYGRVDIRARLPYGQGMWPALWMLDSNTNHEIDIMEMVSDPTIVYQHYHVNVPTMNSYVPSCIYKGPNFSTGFHTYSVVWKSSAIAWLVDGVLVCQVTQQVVQKPMYLLLDVAIGGSWPGAPDSTTLFPQYTDIDYVRVYQ
jgi:hypothetical protein